MRFVTGLIFGAGLILLAAQQSDGRWLREVPRWLDGLANAAGAALALPPRPPAAPDASGDAGTAPAGTAPAHPGESAREAAALTAGVEPAQQPITRRPDPPAPDAGRVRAPLADGRAADGRAAAAGAAPTAPDAAGPSAQASTLEPRAEDVQRLVAEIFQAPGGVEEPAAAGTAPGGAGGDAGRLSTAAGGSATAGGSAAANGRAAVWVPFHSRMSADGFAERLSESLDHPFRVEREGPGRYQVVFAYADESERQALLDEAAAATGLPL